MKLTGNVDKKPAWNGNFPNVNSSSLPTLACYMHYNSRTEFGHTEIAYYKEREESLKVGELHIPGHLLSI